MRKIIKINYFEKIYTFHLSHDCGWYRLVMINDATPLDTTFSVNSDEGEDLESVARFNGEELIKLHQLLLDDRRSSKILQQFNQRRKTLLCNSIDPELGGAILSKLKILRGLDEDEVDALHNLLSIAIEDYDSVYSNIIAEIFQTESSKFNVNLFDQFLLYAKA